MAARKSTPAKPKGPVYRALRPLVVGEKSYAVGDVVENAQNWPRVEAWIRARKIELVEA